MGINAHIDMVHYTYILNSVPIDYIDYQMIKTKKKDFHQILVDSEIHETLHPRYGAGRTYNEVINEILRHHESAVSIIGDCEYCREKFKQAVASSK